jgi:hypothetical protein
LASSLTPTEGARFLLERAAAAESPVPSDVSAVYRVAIYTPDATFEGRATLADDGSVELVMVGDAVPPNELVAMLEMQARLVARGAAKRRVDGLPAWPARVLRWRGPGRGE